MENLLLSPDEQKIVLKFKNKLERKLNVTISLPENLSSCPRDIVVATVLGENINLVKNFIQRRITETKHRQEQNIAVQNNVTTITLSDSDSDSSFPVLLEMQQKRKKKQNRRKKKIAADNDSNILVDLSSTILIEDTGESGNENCGQKRSNAEKENMKSNEMNGEINMPTKVNAESPVPLISPLDNSQITGNIIEDKALNDTIILSDSPAPDFISLRSRKKKGLKRLNAEKRNLKFNEIDNRTNFLTKVIVESPIISTNLTLVDNAHMIKNTIEDKAPDNTIFLSDSPTSHFISLRSKKENIPNDLDDSDIIIEDEIPRPVMKTKRLRPIVIDGSNVARAHGKVTNTYSCKGIQIAIDYFLQRGHEKVTAFVPRYRQHNKYGPILTTDQPLLEELNQLQRVVFTPSRKIDNKSFTCYDDRFIVDLATKTGGVILSNDNYRDLAAESEEFKTTINERLLMFCFVADIIMIPQDPLGRNGPSLENFLSFPD